MLQPMTIQKNGTITWSGLNHKYNEVYMIADEVGYCDYECKEIWEETIHQTQDNNCLPVYICSDRSSGTAVLLYPETRIFLSIYGLQVKHFFDIHRVLEDYDSNIKHCCKCNSGN